MPYRLGNLKYVTAHATADQHPCSSLPVRIPEDQPLRGCCAKWLGTGVAPPRAVELLALLGTDCVTLANNYALDYGVAAAGRLVLADLLGGGRQPRHGVVSRAEQVVVGSFRIVS